MRQSHRLDLVVGDIDRGDAERALHMLQLGAHMAAQLGIEIGQRFVHQEHRRAADDRPCERNALTLAARQLARIAIEQRLELDLLRRIEDGRVHLGLR